MYRRIPDFEPSVIAPERSLDTSSSPAYEDLAERFRPIFVRIGQGALDREKKRELPFEAVKWLIEAGFGAVRIPARHGGGGATLPQLFGLLMELGAADSNVYHLLRGHFAFLEGRLNSPDTASQDFWFPKVANGAFIGYAMAERTEVTGSSVRLTPEGDHWILCGKKYYSTGTIYADWIVVAAVEGDDRISVAVPAGAPGVTREDDWDGFGQRMTGSGTTVFDRVQVPEAHIIRRFSAGDAPEKSYNLAFLQLILLATLAGIGRAAVGDAVAFVQGRTRTFGVPGPSSPRAEPLVQRVVGRLSSLSFAAETLVEGVAQALERIYQGQLKGTVEKEVYSAAIIKAFQAQQIVIDLVLQATTLLFEVGGASATSTDRCFDRHWRNARAAASHNPAIYRERAIGDYLLNGTPPESGLAKALRETQAILPGG